MGPLNASVTAGSNKIETLRDIHCSLFLGPKHESRSRLVQGSV
jgi:hypothetical protein